MTRDVWPLEMVEDDWLMLGRPVSFTFSLLPNLVNLYQAGTGSV